MNTIRWLLRHVLLKWCENQDFLEKELLETNPKAIIRMGVLFPGTAMSSSVLEALLVMFT